jgi:hypothetical protein
MSVPATIEQTLGKLIPLLASNHDGEVVATARAIERLLKASGCDWHDLAATICPPDDPDWRRDLRYCASNSARMQQRERDFVATLVGWRGGPTDKQLRWLRSIAARLRSNSAARAAA